MSQRLGLEVAHGPWTTLARAPTSVRYLRLASTLGETLAKRKIGLVFGGGKAGRVRI